MHYSLKTTVECCHIYGLKDKHNPYHILPRDALLNVLVDGAAQAYFDTLHKIRTFIPNARFNTDGWVATIGGVKIQDKLLLSLRRDRQKETPALLVWERFNSMDYVPSH